MINYINIFKNDDGTIYSSFNDDVCLNSFEEAKADAVLNSNNYDYVKTLSFIDDAYYVTAIFKKIIDKLTECEGECQGKRDSWDGCYQTEPCQSCVIKQEAEDTKQQMKHK